MTTNVHHRCGIQYRVLVSTPCSGMTAASAAATITVNAAPPTPLGLVVDDRFGDGLYNNLPHDTSNSVWLAGVAGSLSATSGEYLWAQPGTVTANWLGFFTEPGQPVHLAVGRALKATLVFRGSGIVASDGALRMGVFGYADGGARPVADGFGNATGGVNVRGYMTAINYGASFSGNPFTQYARNNLAVADLMGSIANFAGMGGGPAGLAGQPAFQNDVDYTLEFLVARRAAGLIEFTTTVTGGGATWTHSAVDTVYVYPRFDAFAIRAGHVTTTATEFRISQFRVEVVPAPPVAPAPEPLGVSFSGGNVTLTWSNPAFALQAAPEVTGVFTNVPGAASPHVVPASASRMFYRLVWSP